MSEIINKLLEIIEEDIQRQVNDRVSEIIKKYEAELPRVTGDVAKDGTIIKPYLIRGVKYITRKEAAAILDIQMPALWNWTKNGKVSSIKLGRRVYYRYDEIVNFYSDNSEKINTTLDS